MDVPASDEYEWRERETTMANVWYAGSKGLSFNYKGTLFFISIERPLTAI